MYDFPLCVVQFILFITVGSTCTLKQLVLARRPPPERRPNGTLDASEIDLDDRRVRQQMDYIDNGELLAPQRGKTRIKQSKTCLGL